MLRIGESQYMIEVWRECTHFDDQFWHPTLDRILPTVFRSIQQGWNSILENRQIVGTDLSKMNCHSELLLYAPRMPKITSEGGVDLLLGLVFTQLLDYLLIYVRHL